jgi:1-deoxy-D-xylulose-5-phosphate synthase
MVNLKEVGKMILEKIQKENDIKRLKPKYYDALAEEIREFLVSEISNTGGHLASNLGAVELTMALHLSLDLPKDKIVWDVGHQAYTHKILTGRREGFVNLRGYGGMSGFPKTSESACDVFNTGHSSTSISAGLGLVEARNIKNEDHTVVSVIGDGSMTGGMAYEALNNASELDTNFIIVLNDNNMSIAENVGGMNKYLNGARTATGYLGLKECMYNSLQKTMNGDHVVDVLRTAKNAVKQLMIPGMFFEDMDLTYLGPVDGHDVELLKKTLEEAKRCKNGVLVHVITEKGRGYEPAMKYPTKFHGPAPFDIKTGLPKKQKEKATWTDVFSTSMIKQGRKDKNVVAITAAMPDGTGLKRFSEMYPRRFFDVGIAEQHAVTFAAGLAAGGLKPVVAIYSSFMQRAYDQVLHDVCLQNLPVVFAIDRGGLVGSDGETHQGIFDLSFLTTIPNLTMMSPKNKWELADMMNFAVKYDGPIAIRYPRGSAYDGLEDFHAPIELGKSELIYEEKEVVLFAVGHMMEIAEQVRERLHEQGKKCSIVNTRFVAPIDKEMLVEMGKKHKVLVTMEENVASGGYGEHVSAILEQERVKTKHITIAVPDVYVEHGNVDLLRKDVGLDADSVVKRINDTL